MADKRPQTIADLGQGPQSEQKPVKIENLLKEKRSIEERIKRLEAERNAENEMLEAGGYDYAGEEDWARAMERVGRR